MKPIRLITPHGDRKLNRFIEAGVPIYDSLPLMGIENCASTRVSP